MRKDERLLREAIRSMLLSEDDSGGSGYGGFDSGEYAGIGGGMGYNYGKSLAGIFITPFIDVFKTVQAAGSKVLVRSHAMIQIVAETTLTTVIPFLQSNYTGIFKRESAQLQKIKAKYAPVFAANDAAFTTDVKILAFALNPAACITAKAATTAPQLVLKSLGYFAQGNDAVKVYLDDVTKRLRDIEQNLKDDVTKYKVGQKGDFVAAGARGPYMTTARKATVTAAKLTADSKRYPGSMLEIAAAPTRESQIETLFQTLFADPQFSAALQNSSLVKEMAADAMAVSQGIARDVLKAATGVLKTTTLEQLQSTVKQSLGLEKLKGLQAAERTAFEAKLLDQAKAAMKKFYIEVLTKEVETIIAGGIPANNPYVLTLTNTLAKIKTL